MCKEMYKIKNQKKKKKYTNGQKCVVQLSRHSEYMFALRTRLNWRGAKDLRLDYILYRYFAYAVKGT